MDDLSESKHAKAGHYTDAWSLGIKQTWALEEEHYFILSDHDYAVMELLAMRHNPCFSLAYSFIHLSIHGIHYTIFKVCDV